MEDKYEKNIFYLLAVLSINLYGCTTFDNNNEQQIQTYIEEIKEKQDSIEEETEAQQKKDIDSDETTGMNQIESIDYQDYSGFGLRVVFHMKNSFKMAV